VVSGVCIDVSKRLRIGKGTYLYVTVENWALDAMIIEKFYLRSDVANPDTKKKEATPRKI
jgi:hypothetical protein